MDAVWPRVDLALTQEQFALLREAASAKDIPLHLGFAPLNAINTLVSRQARLAYFGVGLAQFRGHALFRGGATIEALAALPVGDRSVCDTTLAQRGAAYYHDARVTWVLPGADELPLPASGEGQTSQGRNSLSRVDSAEGIRQIGAEAVAILRRSG